MTRKKFLRSKWRTSSKLGKGRKKKQKWRKPKGRDTQMRLKRKGNPKSVSIGYKKKKDAERKAEIIHNIGELLKVKKGEKIIIGRMGKKKKLEAVGKCKEKGIHILNINVKKFLEKAEKERKRKQKIKKGRKAKETEKKEKSKSGKEKKKEYNKEEKKEKSKGEKK